MMDHNDHHGASTASRGTVTIVKPHVVCSFSFFPIPFSKRHSGEVEDEESSFSVSESRS
jgi:hypothetical protein